MDAASACFSKDMRIDWIDKGEQKDALDRASHGGSAAQNANRGYSSNRASSKPAPPLKQPLRINILPDIDVWNYKPGGLASALNIPTI